jgi:OOP family OmpA-OmpF porin
MMKQTHRMILIMAMLAAGLLTACATPTPLQPLPAFDPQPVDTGTYAKKADNLFFILDASSSMENSYGGNRKLDLARAVIQNFSDTMPDADVTVLLRSFGHAASVSPNNTELLMPAGTHSPAALTAALNKVQDAGGPSPLGKAAAAIDTDLEGLEGKSALILLTDAEGMGTRPPAAAVAAAETLGGRICIYPVQIGDDADGAILLREVAALTDCGKTVNADDLMSGPAMNAFVRDVLFTAKRDSDGDGVADDVDRCPATPPGAVVNADGCRPDSDGDGVFDAQDQCPGTAAGAPVDTTGCPIPAPEPAATDSAEITAAGTWLYKDIQFDTNRANLKASSHETLDEIARALEAQTMLNIEIQGHTDSRGTRGYNLELSQKRAASVKAYLVNQGIDASRMSTKGFGPDRPIESNATQEGRARNRRVEVKPIQR